MTRHNLVATVAAAAAALFPAATLAQDGSWSQLNAGYYNWGDAANWNNGSVADGFNSTATFAGVATGPVSVNVDSPRSVGNLVFNMTSPGVTIGGTNPLTLIGLAPTIYADLSATIAAPLIGDYHALNLYGGNYGGSLTLTGDNAISGFVVYSGTLAVSRTATTNPLGAANISLDGGELQLGLGFAGEAPQIFSNNVAVSNNWPSHNPTIDVRCAAGASLGGLTVSSRPVYVTASAGATTLAVGTVLTGGSPTLNIGAGMTMTVTAFSSGSLAYTFTKAGAGTLTAAGPAVSLTPGTGFVVSAGILNLNDTAGFGSLPVVSVNGGALNLAAGINPTFASLDGTGASAAVFLNGNTLTLGGSNSTSYAGKIMDGSAPGVMLRAGAGTLTLSGTNTYSGGTVINSGGITVAADANLGSGNITGASLGTLTFAGTTTTAKSFAMNGGTISVSAGQTVTLNRATVSAATFDGAGTFSTNAVNGARIVNIATTPSVTIMSNSPADQLVHITNGGAFSVAGGVNANGAGTAVALNGFINQGLGSITVGAASQINVANFQSYGTLTLLPATVGASPHQTTLLTNLGAAPLGFNGGSRTFIGTPQTANDPNTGLPTFVAGIDLHGQNAIVASGLFVNNGYVEDTTNNGQGTATVIADFGSLVKGAGYFQNSVQTINGGKFQAGNSPGKATFGSFVLGPGGVSNYVFAIDDATGAAGPSPDAAGHVSGWGLVQVGAPPVAHGGLSTQGDFTWTATPADKLTVAIETLLNPTTVGNDIAGLMDHFDPSHPYIWPAVEWTGPYAGPADVAMLDAATTFDMTGFANPVAGRFGWALDENGHSLSLTYTPAAVPEPGSLLLTGCMAGLGWFTGRKRG
jgi:autotransporter-associated beta strand protein